MTNEKIENQPALFEPHQIEVEKLLLYALGEFQSRDKLLAERELPLDRLRGAFRRAAEKFQLEELADEVIIERLEKMGAAIVRKPSFVAKHPFRVTVHKDLAEKAKAVFEEILKKDE